MLERLIRLIASSWRDLRVDPATIAAAVLTLGAATGMNVAMFSLIDRALLGPPRYVRHPERVFSLAFQTPGEPDPNAGMTTTSYVAFRTLRDQVPAFSRVAAFQPGPESVVVGGEQVRAQTLLVSGHYFDLLGAQARIGRALAAADEHDAMPTTVLSHAFWIARYGGDAAILGRHVAIAGIEYTVVGVMPAGFSGHSAAAIDIWVPVTTAMRGSPGWDQTPFRNVVSVIARLADGISPATAAAQATAALERGVGLRAAGAAEVGATERRIALWLGGISLLVLFIGLANAATLLLVRGARRRRAWAIRSALGATRAHLLLQAAVEAVFVAAMALVVSLATGVWLDDLLRRILLPGVRAADGLEPRTLLAAILAGAIMAVVAAAAGAWAVPADMRPDDLRVGHGTGRSRLQTGLLLVQTAISVLLLAGAGMFARSLSGLLDQDFGMRMDGLVVVDFEPGPEAVSDQYQLFADALVRVGALPGVQAVTAFRTLPFGAHDVPPIAIPGRAEPPSAGGQLPYLIAATPELFDILGIRIVQGRAFAAEDDRGEMVTVVNETMAREVWPGEIAIGKCIRIGFDPSFDPLTASGPPVPSAAVPCRRVIGVARDVRQRSVVPTGYEDRLMQYYVPMSQVPAPPGGMPSGPGISGLVVRAAVDPSTLTLPLRRLVLNDRDDLPYLRVRPYAELLQRQVHPWQLGATLLTLFGALAITVASIGLYAAFAHAVLERRREMAIRIAVGASPSRVLAMVMREAVRLTAAGIVVGVAAACLAGRSLQSILFGIAPNDPFVLGGAAAAMLAVVAMATFLPARSASRSDPNSLLRAE